MTRKTPAHQPGQIFQYNQGTITVTKAGTYLAVRYHQGSRVLQQRAKTLTAAQKLLDQAHIAILNNTQPLTSLQLEEARNAFQRLPKDTSLLEVVNFYIQRKGTAQPQPLTNAVNLYLDNQATRGLRDRSIRATRNFTLRLAAAFPDALLTDLTTTDLATALEDFGVSGRTYNNYARYWRIFLDWCINRQFLQENPARHLQDHLVDDDIAAFFPVPQVIQWFQHLQATNPDLIPFMYLNFFAGVRVTELHRMTGDLITPELIKVIPTAAKTRTMRFITPGPNLAAWIHAYPPPNGPIARPNHFETLRHTRQALNNFPWVQNGGRKSYATYRLAQTQNAPATAAELGHTSVNLLYTTYRGLATPEEANQYFSITPN